MRQKLRKDAQKKFESGRKLSSIQMEMERHLSFESGKSARVGDGFFDSDASYRNMAQLAG
jgi:hypothetical protein